MVHSHPTYLDFMVSERHNKARQDKQALRLASIAKGQRPQDETRAYGRLSAWVGRALTYLITS
jgi:hypothetical protein